MANRRDGATCAENRRTCQTECGGSERDWIVNTFFPQRTAIMLDDLRDENLYPGTSAPEFDQHGGLVDAGFELLMAHDNPAGQVWYTLDGSDPRLPGGQISPVASEYSSPVSIDANVTVRARVWTGFEWSALNEATFSLSQQPIRITELNYHPHDPSAEELAAIPRVDADDFEFIEFHNLDAEQAVNVGGYTLAGGVQYTFPPTEIAPGEYVVVVENEAAFRSRYGDGVRVLGQWSGGLSNSGEELELRDAVGEMLTRFEYADGIPWPERADGDGATLELSQPASTPTAEFGKYYRWRASTDFGGSPGQGGRAPQGIVINEVLTRTDAAAGLRDAIELFNPTDEAVDLSGWFLSDSARNFLKFEIPAGTLLAPGDYIVFDERDFNPNPPNPGPDDFALSGAGDDVWLVVPNGSGGIAEFVDDVHFGGARPGETLGRFPNGDGRLAPQSRNSLGCANRYIRVGPVIISELNFNPGEPSAAALAVAPQLVEDDLEFVEIFNATRAPVQLDDWRLRGGVDFDFDDTMVLQAESSLAVVAFNPENADNAERLAGFRAHYGIDETVTIVGGFAGQLSDSGESIRLESPDDTDALQSRVSQDQFVYDDRVPWPAADGNGNSLKRVAPTAAADAAGSWRALTPTPGGHAELVRDMSADLNADSRLDAHDLDILWDAVRRQSPSRYYDLDDDGFLSDADVVYMVNVHLDTHPGDVDLNGVVDGEDLNAWQSNAFTNCGSWSTADFNGDGLTDGSDFNVWNLHRFQAAAASQPAPRNREPRAALPQAFLPVIVDARADTPAGASSPSPFAADVAMSREPAEWFPTASRRRASQFSPDIGRSNATDRPTPEHDDFFAELERVFGNELRQLTHPSR